MLDLAADALVCWSRAVGGGAVQAWGRDGAVVLVCCLIGCEGEEGKDARKGTHGKE